MNYSYNSSMTYIVMLSILLANGILVNCPVSVLLFRNISLKVIQSSIVRIHVLINRDKGSVEL